MIAALQQAEGFLGESVGTGGARLHLFGELYFSDPWFLALLPLGLAALVWGRRAAARPVARVAGLPASALPQSLRQRLARVPLVLHVLALAALSVALARPVRADVVTQVTSEGIDIALVIDRSGSMQYTDLDPRKTRLDVVKEVVGDFARRRMTDQVGAADNVALLSFARFPQLLCPFTLDVNALETFLESVDLVRYDQEDGTAIGRGLAKAVAVLDGSDAESKVVVLLTDGENNVEDITPRQAAALAAEKGVRVYTVLAGRLLYEQDLFGRIYPSDRQIDSTELEAIAEVTGGRFFRARDRAALEDVYAEIEELERTPRQEDQRTLTYDLYPSWLLAGLLLHCGAWLLATTAGRRLL